MATYWVPDLLNIKRFLKSSKHTYNSNLWPPLMFFELKIINIFKWVGTRKSELPWEQNSIIAVGVLSVELLAYQVSMVCASYKIGLSV